VRKLTILVLATLALTIIPSLATTAQAETGIASYYRGRGPAGGMTCAHKTAPFTAVTSTSTLNSGRVKPETITSVDAKASPET
jgi:hypothetical protein